jgi:DNA-nicking Smr family endonuclease
MPKPPQKLTTLSGLKAVRDELKQSAEARARRDREAALAAEQAEREANLFRLSIGDVQPLKTKIRVQHQTALPEPIAHQHLRDEQAALAESLSDEFDALSLLETDDSLSWRRDGIGPDVVRKLRRGEWVIQAQLDLHGARREEARERLADFLRNSLKRGLRCVRVIHGKGLGSIDKQPVLKGKVRNWLAQKDEVLAFCQARAQDGGSGALIVLLRPSQT